MVQIARHPETVHAHAETVIKETLRLYPPIWSVGREVLRAAEFGSYTLSTGTIVLISPRLMHLDPRWWREDPAAFLPGRWLDPGRPAHEPHAYIPYGAGPRVCTGARLAQAILTEAFGLVASSWRVTLNPPLPVAVPAAVVVPDPLSFTLTPR